MSKSILAALKFISKPEEKNSDPIINRRNRLLERLQEQKALALCYVDGKPFVGPDKQKKVVNKETGETTTEIVQKRIKAWFSGSADDMLLEVRYGNVAMELVPGKTAVEVGKVAKLVPTIETVIEAVAAGEVDELLKAYDKPTKAKTATK